MTRTSTSRRSAGSGSDRTLHPCRRPRREQSRASALTQDSARGRAALRLQASLVELCAAEAAQPHRRHSHRRWPGRRLGLVIAQDQETLRVRTPIGGRRPAVPRLPRHAARPSADVRRQLHRSHQRRRRVSGDAGGDRAGASTASASKPTSSTAGKIAARSSRRRSRPRRSAASTCSLVFDSIGAKTMDARIVERLRTAPAARSAGSTRCASYSLEEVNYRTHRKALVIDGDVGVRRRHRHRRPVGQ